LHDRYYSRAPFILTTDSSSSDADDHQDIADDAVAGVRDDGTAAGLVPEGAVVVGVGDNDTTAGVVRDDAVVASVRDATADASDIAVDDDVSSSLSPFTASSAGSAHEGGGEADFGDDSFPVSSADVRCTGKRAASDDEVGGEKRLKLSAEPIPSASTSNAEDGPCYVEALPVEPRVERTIDWDLVASRLTKERMKSLINQKVAEYFKESNEQKDFISSMVLRRCQPHDLFEELKKRDVPSEKAKKFVNMLFQLLIDEIEGQKEN
jgi:hypothetical protein